MELFRVSLAIRIRESLYSCCFLFSILMLCQVPHLEAYEEGDTCMIKQSLPGVCRSSSKCEPIINKYIQTGRLTIRDVPSCGLGPREEIVCCPVAECCDNDKGPETTTVRTFQPTPTTRVDVPTQERPAVRACRFIENRKKEEHLTIHILDGIPVEPGYYPHMAAIAFSNFGNFDYRCGGSLISSRHVLTAAHCFISDMPVHVRLGSVNIAEPTHHQDIAVSQNVMIHPDYVRSSKYNDVAILELVKEAELNFWVYPACLSLDLLDPPLNAQLFVAGWGTMNQTTRRTSKILLRAPLTVVPLPQCNELYAEQPMSVRNLKDGVIDSLMCAADTKESKKDACGGDSGGPLILETDIVNSKYTIMGIINSGFGCATKTPGLYTRVASFLDWIEKIVWPDNVV